MVLRFFLFLALFVSLVLGCDFSLAYLFDKLYTKTRTGQTGGEINYYLSSVDPTKTLIMGNSRARYQVNPDSFAAPAYSLCHAGMSQVFQTGLLHVLEQENKLPPVVLLHVDFEEYMSGDDMEDIGNLRYYYGSNPAVTDRINEISRYERSKYLFRFYRHNGRTVSVLKNYLQSRTSTPPPNGYQAMAPSPNDSTTFGEPVTKYDSSRPHFHYRNLRHLQDFIATCKRRGIRLLCFTSPYYSPREFASVAALPLDSLFKAQGIPYFNAAAHPLRVLKHHALFWQDGDHLNQLGAGYLSKQLAQWSQPYLVNMSSLPGLHQNK